MQHKTPSLILLILVVQLGGLNSAQIKSDQNYQMEKDEVPFREMQFNDDYNLKWWYNVDNKTVHFECTVRTTGFIGFGISPAGGMKGADIVIGGVYTDGTPYFWDMHGIGNQEPVMDEQQNWFLDSAEEDDECTCLKFHRLIDTCDDDDVQIDGSTTKFIWSYGDDGDQIQYHGADHRGSSSVSILDPPNPAHDFAKFDKSSFQTTAVLPAQETTYYCQVYKAPQFDSKRHAVALEIDLSTPELHKFTHHLVFSGCNLYGSSAGINLDSYVGHGQLCSNMTELEVLCYTPIYTWVVGGGPYVFPDDVGYPINDEYSPQYYKVEYHWHNPALDKGIVMRNSINIYHTPHLRTHDAGTLHVGHLISPLMVVPPNSTDFVTSAHCASKCMTKMFPEDGINVFSVLLHSHYAGRKMKLRHFRPEINSDNETIVKELRPLSEDLNYDFEYQEYHLLRKPTKLLGGDQLTIECTYTNTWRQPLQTTFGGQGTSEEMCVGFLGYYPRINNLGACVSFISIKELLSVFGFTGLNMAENFWDPTVYGDDFIDGKPLSQVMNEDIDWTPSLRSQFQNVARFSRHSDMCLTMWDLETDTNQNSTPGRLSPLNFESDTNTKSTYPSNFEPYEAPPRACEVVE